VLSGSARVSSLSRPSDPDTNYRLLIWNNNNNKIVQYNNTTTVYNTCFIILIGYTIAVQNYFIPAIQRYPRQGFVICFINIFVKQFLYNISTNIILWNIYFRELERHSYLIYPLLYLGIRVKKISSKHSPSVKGIYWYNFLLKTIQYFWVCYHHPCLYIILYIIPIRVKTGD